MNGTSAMKSSRPRVRPVYWYNPNGTPVRVDESSATSATGHTLALNASVRRQPRSATPATTYTAKNAKTYGRRVMVPRRRRSIREVSVIESACYHHAREGPAGRDRARPGAPARPTGSRRRLQPLRGRPGQPVRDDQGVLRHEDGRPPAERSRDGVGARAHPRDGRAGE